MKRLLAYLKPHKWVMTAATVLVLFIIVVELYRPIVIGDAIDDYINGYYAPYIETTADAPGAVPYHDTYLTRDFEAADGQNYDQILLYNNQYYMAENLSSEECDALKNADAATLSSYVNQSATSLTRDDLKDLRHYDFAGILKAAALYLLLLLTGFVLNALDTWILQKMGQEIIYQMREEVFTHIHSLSLNFFNNTPVGKLVTRVSNDTEAVNELFSTILVKLFKNIVKIIGYAVVMLSINVKMALVSFALLPLVTVLTFFFRFMSRKAYELTRNRITDLNTFLSEHLSGMKLIQIFAREEEKYAQFEKKSEDLYKANWREVMTFAIFRPSIYLVSVLAMMLVIGTGSAGVLNQTLSLGTLFIFITYISSFFDPIQELAEQFGTLQSSLASAGKIFSILDEKPDIVKPTHPVEVNIKGRIEFRHVWFAYEKDDYILKDISFVIEPGEKVAFVGATGAGKSSILNLIGRYFDIQKGEILIDGVNIKDLPVPRLIDVRLKKNAEVDFIELAEKLAEVSPQASLDNHKLWLNKLIKFADGLKMMALSVLLLVVVVTSGAIFYSTKTSLGLHQHIIEILHLMGAKDAYVAQQYARRTAQLGFVGGVIGLIFAIPSIFAISRLAEQIEGGIISDATLSVQAWGAILSLPVFASLIAMMTAYYTVKRTLEKMM